MLESLRYLNIDGCNLATYSNDNDSLLSPIVTQLFELTNENEHKMSAHNDQVMYMDGWAVTVEKLRCQMML